MKNKQTYYIVGFLGFALIVYLLFFRKKRPEDLKVGDISIQPGPNNVPRVFKCLRTINPQMGQDYKMSYKSSDFPLKFGDCGMAVEEVQKRLITEGVMIKADGKFGKQTEEALNKIYASKGQAQTGQFTWNQYNATKII